MKERMQNEDAERSAVDDLEVRPIDAEMRKDLSEEKLSHETIAGSEQHSSSSIHEEKQDVENSPDLSQGDCPPTEVSRSQRRGLFGRFTVIAEVQEPKHYSRKIKWFITFVIALAAVAAPLGSAIIFRKPPSMKTWTRTLLISTQHPYTRYPKISIPTPQW